MILGLIIGFIMVEDSTGEHFRVSHTFIGILTIIFAAATPIIGYFMFRNKDHIKLLVAVHRWSGRITIILMVLTILSGMSTAGIL